jgi:hypothetical protein
MTRPWEELLYALETDYASAAVASVLNLIEAGETESSIRDFLSRNEWGL